ncbi:S41 family peptidase [Aliikangiella sp. G2MR2-5]|uniref:S41 family peptidase n=1 Tax=Aliikangiella sp. G2MR2-5 TaxID=2788943 RepID=UPI0018AAD8B4|nr:S41 family peptidase [Aliikangiella sp. G2MR2-5]
MSLNRTLTVSVIVVTALLSFSGCGGGGGLNDTPDPSTSTSWTQGVFADESQFKNLCQSPRSGTDLNGDAFPDIQGTTAHENHFLRSWSNNTYLWYSEIPDLNPNLYDSPTDYFALLKTSATTQSGSAKDNFHFYMDTAEYQQLTQSGVSVSYGIEWELVSSTPPRELYIRYIEPGSPADAIALGLSRGAQITHIDGVDVENANTQAGVNTLNAGLFPSESGESHTFTVLDVGSVQPRDVVIQASEVTYDPVPIVNTFASGQVGYIFFNDHNFVSEDRLYEEMTAMSEAGVTDLILDLRYNGGGLLYIASQLAYMVAGDTATSGKTFEEIRFNDKYPTVNPVTGQALQPTPFYSTISQYSDNYTQGTALPTLNLSRVFILSTDSTCSASEAIINGLRGIDIEVILVGTTTCGKPYGFYPTDNCGTTYFTIQFDGINDKGEGGYSDGFSPINTVATPGVLITGCSVNDDLTSTLGEISDPLVSAALSYRTNGSCPVAATSPKRTYSPTLKNKAEAEGLILDLPLRLNQKIYLDPNR